MMNKTLVALITATTMASASAAIKISGNYEGVMSTSSGPAVYTQDLDLKVQGGTGDTKFKATFENLTGGSNVAAKQLSIETKLEGLDFKGGTFKTQNGIGLLQKKVNANQMQLATDIGDMRVSVSQVSGESSATIDTRVKLGGATIKVNNASNSDRFITLSADVASVNVVIERQTTTVGTNTAVSAGITSQAGFGITAIMIDIKDAAGVTQNDGVFGNIKNVATGTTIKGGVLTMPTSLGDLTAKMYDIADVNTYSVEIKRGMIEYGYTKADNADAVLDATISVAF